MVAKLAARSPAASGPGLAERGAWLHAEPLKTIAAGQKPVNDACRRFSSDEGGAADTSRARRK